ncbi:serine/arginine repetitive matrix protein 2-like [Ornithodoros turicata]|uniref:serine/arginine repetitive matrix protein 2-like n=1 Tax=Ornithodoros turicata TaxID=34597 RepID=UPI003138773F
MGERERRRLKYEAESTFMMKPQGQNRVISPVMPLPGGGTQQISVLTREPFSAPVPEPEPFDDYEPPPAHFRFPVRQFSNQTITRSSDDRLTTMRVQVDREFMDKPLPRQSRSRGRVRDDDDDIDAPRTSGRRRRDDDDDRPRPRSRSRRRDGEDDDDRPRSRCRSRNRGREDDDDRPLSRSRSRGRRRSDDDEGDDRPKSRSRSRGRRRSDDDDDDDRPKSRSRSRGRRRDDEDADDRPRRRKSRKRIQDDDGDDNDDRPKSRSSSRRRRKDDDDDEDDDDDRPKSRKRRRSKKRDDEDDGGETRKNRITIRRVEVSEGRRRRKDLEDHNKDDGNDEEEEKAKKKRRRRRRRMKVPSYLESSSEDDEDDMMPRRSLASRSSEMMLSRGMFGSSTMMTGLPCLDGEMVDCENLFILKKTGEVPVKVKDKKKKKKKKRERARRRAEEEARRRIEEEVRKKLEEEAKAKGGDDAKKAAAPPKPEEKKVTISEPKPAEKPPEPAAKPPEPAVPPLDLGNIELGEPLTITVPVIFVFGGPGSGKGTQCENIVKKYEFTHISTGDLLRADVASGSPRGQALNEIMKKGELVPPDIVLVLLKEKMKEGLEAAKGFLIDGYPRNLEQADKFDTSVCKCSKVVYFEVKDETMTARLLERGKTSGRVDDNEETIKKRLETFHKETEPVLEKYKDIVEKVSAEDPPDKVFEGVIPIVDKLLEKPPA